MDFKDEVWDFTANVSPTGGTITVKNLPTLTTSGEFSYFLSFKNHKNKPTFLTKPLVDDVKTINQVELFTPE
jgi:hypothetical protein